jgi:NitT/TauT family transport system ATP-binding protein
LPQGKIRGITDEFVRLVGLERFADRYPSQLSGGMKQRVAIARVLANNANILLMDEPFGALDAQTREVMHDLILHILAIERRTILFVTHDVDEAIFLADRVVVMRPRPGRIGWILDIEIPRPRAMDCLTSPTFVETKRRIMDMLYSQATLHGVPDPTLAVPA